MKNIIFIILAFIFLFSCTSYDASKNLNTQKAELAHSKFTNINNDYSYNEYITNIYYEDIINIFLIYY